MKHFILILTVVTSLFKQENTSATHYTCKNVRISLYSEAPLEDISAVSQTGKSVYNPATGDLAFSVAIRSFRFKKSRMEEHFNENYMESDKYPQATFKGKVAEKIDVSRDGIYPVTVTGVLDVHGVKQTRTVKGTVKLHNGTISMAAEFMVKCADHHIEIPKIVFHNIAETIKMNVSATYIPNKTNTTE